MSRVGDDLNLGQEEPRPRRRSAIFDFQPRLQGALLTMRPYEDADFEALYAVASDPLIWALHPMPERYRRPVFQAFIADAEKDRGGLVAVARSSDAIVGFSRFSEAFVPTGEMEIGWTFLARSLWGGAFNRDMKQMMLAHLLASYPRAIFRIGEGNLRSRRAIVKIGGEQLDWDLALDISGRAIRYIAYQITRAAFAQNFPTT